MRAVVTSNACKSRVSIFTVSSDVALKTWQVKFSDIVHVVSLKQKNALE